MTEPLPPDQDSEVSNPRQVLHADLRYFVLADEAVYAWRLPEADGDTPPGVYRLVVAEGFRHDFASVPRLLWTFIAPLDLGLASIFHDWLYRAQGRVETLRWTEAGWNAVREPWTRREADRLFGRIMREQGVASWKRRLAFYAVRAFGGSVWGRPCRPDPAPPR